MRHPAKADIHMASLDEPDEFGQHVDSTADASNVAIRIHRISGRVSWYWFILAIGVCVCVCKVHNNCEQIGPGYALRIQKNIN